LHHAGEFNRSLFICRWPERLTAIHVTSETGINQQGVLVQKFDNFFTWALAVLTIVTVVSCAG